MSIAIHLDLSLNLIFIESQLNSVAHLFEGLINLESVHVEDTFQPVFLSSYISDTRQEKLQIS